MGIMNNPNASRGPGETRRQARHHRAEVQSQTIKAKGRQGLRAQALLQLAATDGTTAEQAEQRVHGTGDDTRMEDTSPAPSELEAVARSPAASSALQSEGSMDIDEEDLTEEAQRKQTRRRRR